MTTPLSAIEPTDLPDGVPNHHATAEPSRFRSGQAGDPAKNKGPVGIFARSRKANAGPQTRAAKQPVPKLSPSMKQNLEDLYSGIGALVRPFDEYLGDTIIEQAPDCAKSVYLLAQSNEAVRRFIISMTTTTIAGAVIFAHLPILLALMRHNKNPKVKMALMTTAIGIKSVDTEKMFADLKDEGEEYDGE